LITKNEKLFSDFLFQKNLGKRNKKSVVKDTICPDVIYIIYFLYHRIKEKVHVLERREFKISFFLVFLVFSGIF